MHTSGVHEISALSMDLSASKGRASNELSSIHAVLFFLLGLTLCIFPGYILLLDSTNKV